MSANQAIVFDCRGSALLGIVHRPPGASARGAVIVVGGPQYRAGSHRQFYHMAQSLQAAGVATLRFDYRGMGDSEGEPRDFESIDEDIRAAIDALCSEQGELHEVVLIGLCDAASAILMYASGDPRVTGMVLMNPWARAEDSLARSTVRHYYARRIMSAEFWRKMLSGGVNWRQSVSGFGATVRKAFGRGQDGDNDRPRGSFHERMLAGAQAFTGPLLLIISGDDITAAEFTDKVKAEPQWQRVLGREQVTTVHMEAADHTFSSDAWRSDVNRHIQTWLGRW